MRWPVALFLKQHVVPITDAVGRAKSAVQQLQLNPRTAATEITHTALRVACVHVMDYVEVT